MKKIKTFLLLALLLGINLTLIVSNHTASALLPPEPSPTSSSTGNSEVPTQKQGCDRVETSIIDCNSDGGNPAVSILLQFINFLSVGVGIAVLGGIMWGGLIYASSNGDPSQVKQAKTIIVNAIIGLILFIFMFSIVNFLIPGGLFTTPPPTP